MTDTEKASALIEWYKDRTIPDGITYRKGETITDAALFVEAQIRSLSMPVHTVFFKNGYMRLWELKQYILKGNHG